MDILETTDEMVEAIMSCKDKEEAKIALKVVVGFALHDKESMTLGMGQTGLAKKVTLSLLIVAVQKFGKEKGGE